MNDHTISPSNSRPQFTRDVGLAQRLLLWAILASIVGWFFPILLLVTIPFQLYCVFRLSKALGYSLIGCILYCIAMFLPLISLICLLVINASATNALRDAGIKVGIMGAKPSDLPAEVVAEGD